MQTFPQAIQELERQLSHSKGIAKIPLLSELAELYTADYQFAKTLESNIQLLKIASLYKDKESELEALLSSSNILQQKKEGKAAESYLQKAQVLFENFQSKEVQLKWKWHSGMMKILSEKGDLAASESHVYQLLQLVEPHQWKEQAEAYYTLGVIESRKANNEIALNHYFKTLRLLKKIEQPNLITLAFKGTVLLAIAIIYSNRAVFFDRELSRGNETLSYLKEVLELGVAIQCCPLQLGYYIQIGIIQKSNKEYHKALQSYHRALELAKSRHDEKHQLVCQVNIGNIYNTQKQLDKALSYYKEALKVAEKMKFDAALVACNKNIGYQYYLKKNYEKSKEYLQVALQIAEKTNNAERTEIYYMLADIHRVSNDSNLVFEYMEKYILLSKELFSKEKEKSIVEMQTRYETEQKEQEAARLRELEQVKSRFFSQITHEFRTPLTLILGPLEQIVNNKKSIGKEELNNRLSLVIRNGRRLCNLVNQLLDLSKLESGKMTIQRKQGEVIAYVRWLVEAFQSLAEDRQIQLHFSTSTSKLNGYFDPDKLEKILYNLLSNAFKFTPPNGKIEVTVNQQSISSTQSLLQIRLQDTGKGISSEQLPHIFDRFYQADNSSIRQAEGSGIGLSLVKELLELQKGKIEVASKLEVGTTFYVELPLELSSNMPIEKLENTSLKRTFTNPIITRRTALPSKKQISKKRKDSILVVEDNADMQIYIHDILSPHYKVMSAENGEVGVAKALKEMPDLIVSDVMMPLKDGFALCQELKADEKTNHIPIVLLTAKAALSSRIEGLQQGADVYLSKPFSPEELLLNISNLIQVRQKLQEKYAKIIQWTEDNKTEDSMENRFLKKLIQTIEAHLDDYQLSTEKLSEYMYMSRYQIHRKLRALTNYSTTEFIRLIRLKKAKSMLEAHSGTIAEIAYDVGFSSPGYFSKCFVKQYGVSPSKWKGH